MEEPQLEEPPQWPQYERPKSKFEELAQNPVAVLAIGIVIGVLIVSMRPIVVQAKSI